MTKAVRAGVDFRFKTLVGVLILLLSIPLSAGAESATTAFSAPILLYHRFGPVMADRMTVTTGVFAGQLKFLMDHGYTVIHLSQLVDYFLSDGPSPPPRSVVITADDGHRSVYTEMFPLMKQFRIPVTLFIYPSAISHATYALTWEQLKEMQASGLVDVQSHTYWHPNFEKEKKRLAAVDYKRFVEWQLKLTKKILEAKLGIRVEMLAWPFGIYDEELIRQASEAGYIAGFTLERRHASIAGNWMTLPRYLITNGDTGARLERLLEER